MEKTRVEREAILLSEKEKEKLIQCLNYCYHRLANHMGTGLHKNGITKEFVDYMRENL